MGSGDRSEAEEDEANRNPAGTRAPLHRRHSSRSTLPSEDLPSRTSRRLSLTSGDVAGHDDAAKKARKSELPKSTFVDAAAMKEKVRANLTRPKHTVTDYYKDKGICQAIARSSKFEAVSLLVISFNALWIAIDTDLNKSTVLIKAHPAFIIAENLFCAFFSFEWFVRFVSFRRKRDGLKDAWFVFDSLMVALMVLETWCFSLVLLIFLDDNSGGGGGGFLKVARLLRLSRMARMARLLRAMPELMILIKGMTAAARSVIFTLILLVAIMYAFAITFVQLAEDTVVKYMFPTVPDSMFKLLLHGTFLDDISRIARELGKAPAYINIIFFIFVLLGSLTVMNMLIGVLCEVVSAVAATEKEEMLVTYVNQKLQKVVAMLDTDGGGTISRNEFLQILENVDAVRCLQDVGVDVIGLVDFADFIFENDEDGDEKEEVELDFPRFMEVVLQLRGSNTATVKDIVDLRKFIANAMEAQKAAIIEEMRASQKSAIMEGLRHSQVCIAKQVYGSSGSLGKFPEPTKPMSFAAEVQLPIVEAKQQSKVVAQGRADEIEKLYEPPVDNAALSPVRLKEVLHTTMHTNGTTLGDSPPRGGSNGMSPTRLYESPEPIKEKSPSGLKGHWQPCEPAVVWQPCDPKQSPLRDTMPEAPIHDLLPEQSPGTGRPSWTALPAAPPVLLEQGNHCRSRLPHPAGLEPDPGREANAKSNGSLGEVRNGIGNGYGNGIGNGISNGTDRGHENGVGNGHSIGAASTPKFGQAGQSGPAALTGDRLETSTAAGQQRNQWSGHITEAKEPLRL